jgi:hypothetical protein
MLDQSTVYAYADDSDTLVVDEPDAPIAIGRVSTGDLTMQVRIANAGGWHRRTPDLSETACGVPFHSEFGNLRREQLTMEDGGLCAECHTGHELMRAAQNDRAAQLAAEMEQRRREIEDERRTARRWKLPTKDER